MASLIQEAKLGGFVACLPVTTKARAGAYDRGYRENRHRVYGLAFWMTGNEIAAQELMINTFCRAFAASPDPDVEAMDRALVAELRELGPLGPLTLECTPSPEVHNVRRNILREHLERAVVQLPATERMIYLLHDAEGYDHARIARTLGLREEESILGLHQARLRLRELLAAMV